MGGHWVRGLLPQMQALGRGVPLKLNTWLWGGGGGEGGWSPDLQCLPVSMLQKLFYPGSFQAVKMMSLNTVRRAVGVVHPRVFPPYAQ